MDKNELQRHLSMPPGIRTLWALLDVATLAEAKKALAIREGIGDDNIRHSIGYWSPGMRSKGPAADIVAAWAEGREIDGIVWTALKPRMAGVQRTPAVGEVINHLSGLKGAERDVAEEYVRRAPRQITTLYRRAMRRRRYGTLQGWSEFLALCERMTGRKLTLREWAQQ